MAEYKIEFSVGDSENVTLGNIKLINIYGFDSLKEAISDLKDALKKFIFKTKKGNQVSDDEILDLMRKMIQSSLDEMQDLMAFLEDYGWFVNNDNFIGTDIAVIDSIDPFIKMIH